MSQQVNLKDGIDGRHPVILRNDPGVHHVGARVIFKTFVTIHKIKSLSAAVRERKNMLACVYILMPPGNHTFFNEIHHSGAEKLRVDAQVLVTFQAGRERVGQGADAELNHRSVRNIFGNDLSDHRIQRIRFHRQDFRQGYRILHNHRNIGYVDQRFSVNKRHVFVDFDDQCPAQARHHRHVAVAWSEAEVSFFIHRRNGCHRDIDVHGFHDDFRYLMEIGRDKLGQSNLHHVS